MKKLYAYIFGFFAALAMGASSFAVNLRDYALPNNQLRQDLAGIFAGSKDIGRLTRDGQYTDLKSWHWHVGSFRASDCTEYVIKAAKHAPGVQVTHPTMEGIAVIHGSRQNLSRIELAERADRVIRAHGLDKLRTVQRWVYPLSGNDDDLDRADITDADVLIIEEKVQDRAIAQVDLQGIASDSSAAANIVFCDPQHYEQLCTLADKTRIADLHFGNVIEDDQGKWALIDLEDLYLAQRERIEQSPFYVRPVQRWKQHCADEASASIGVAQTGLVGNSAKQKGRAPVGVAANTAHVEANQQKALKLIVYGCFCAFIKKQAFEIAGIVATVQSVTKARIYAANNRKINAFVTKQRDLFNASEDAKVTDAYCLEIAQAIACEELPNEKRPEVIQAFATILKAEALADHSGAVTIFSKKYASSKTALKEARWYLTKTFFADTIFFCRLARKVRSFCVKLPGFSAQPSQE